MKIIRCRDCKIVGLFGSGRTSAKSKSSNQRSKAFPRSKMFVLSYAFKNSKLRSWRRQQMQLALTKLFSLHGDRTLFLPIPNVERSNHLCHPRGILATIWRKSMFLRTCGVLRQSCSQLHHSSFRKFINRVIVSPRS